ncbi:MAG: hypothetical protein NT141_02290 [candidate division WWE3 bacterium]|nr:hypothetical protein [candidate division WWE3 bacterium]
MTPDLSDRQSQLLKAIIEEYIESSEPVGSQNLVEKTQMKVSPATVRNEMVSLSEKGYLSQPHSSAGRAPTSLGWRYYLEHLVTKEELPILQEVALKQRLWQEREEAVKLFYTASHALADTTQSLGVVVTTNGYIFHSGADHLLENAEFFDIDVAQAALRLMNKSESLLKIVNMGKDNPEVRVYFGSEIGEEKLAACSLVVANFKNGKFEGVAGILGPSRMHYNQIIPAVRHINNLLSDLGGAW